MFTSLHLTVLSVAVLKTVAVAAADAGDSCNIWNRCTAGATCSRSAALASVCVSTAAPSGASCGAFQTACQTNAGLNCIGGSCQYSTTALGGSCYYDGQCPTGAECGWGSRCRATNTVGNGGSCTANGQCAGTTAGCLSAAGYWGKPSSTCGPTNTIGHGGKCHADCDCTSTYACSAGPTGSTCAPQKTKAWGRRQVAPTQLPMGYCAKGLSSCPASGNDFKHRAECVNLADDIEHCGSCGNSCIDLDGGVGSFTCSNGACVSNGGSTPTFANRSSGESEAQAGKSNKHSRTSTGDAVRPRKRAVRVKARHA